ncbi:MAG TPA: class I SAM-dependent methyltransferase [Candidatus Acidoferrales bacterium]|nr:class I SAM-dependent methyltransferase [Candidatus Acidoferrales bacterium]
MTGHDDPPLHEMEPIARFSDRAADYVRFRPGYPAAAIDAMLEGLGDPALLAAADVGAGTGISARALAARGVGVTALEPNEAMRSAAEPAARVAWRDGTAEATGLAGGSVDLVLCAQSFHWFRQSEAVSEFHRVLRSGGRLALMWNSRDRTDELTGGFVRAIHAVGGEHPAERREFDPGVVSARGEFTRVRLVTFSNVQELDLAGLIGRATSASYVPREGPGFERLCALLAQLHARLADARGFVRLRYVTQVHLAERLG